ncbi:MAG: hypothetical protein QGH60_17100 [Phycisphaerae bacterium]|jgi:hypothetical protein|nr:hypothetical protein [Phycisphaerae bacterium]
MIAKLFVHPHILQFDTILWLVMPLCASVAIIYKTVRVHDLRQLPRQAGTLIILMLAGLFALGAGLWVIHEYWP